MAEENVIGCARPVGGVEPDSEVEKTLEVNHQEKNNFKEKKMIQVGKKAPDFVSPAYHKG